MSDEGQGEDEGETCYLAGERAALLGALRYVLRELGVEDPESGKARWVIEREEAVAQLRRVCAEHGDNDWPDELHLGDVVEKHLASHLDEAERRRWQDGVDAMGEDA